MQRIVALVLVALLATWRAVGVGANVSESLSAMAAAEGSPSVMDTIPHMTVLFNNHGGQPGSAPPEVRAGCARFLLKFGGERVKHRDDPRTLRANQRAQCYPFDIALMLADPANPDAQEGARRLAMNDTPGLGCRLGALDFLIKSGRDDLLAKVASEVGRNEGGDTSKRNSLKQIEDRNVAMKALVNTRNMTREAADMIYQEITSPSLGMREQLLLAIPSASNMTGERVDLSMRLIKQEPELASRLLSAVWAADGELVRPHTKEIQAVLADTGQSSNARAMALRILGKLGVEMPKDQVTALYERSADSAEAQNMIIGYVHQHGMKLTSEEKEQWRKASADDRLRRDLDAE